MKIKEANRKGKKELTVIQKKKVISERGKEETDVCQDLVAVALGQGSPGQAVNVVRFPTGNTDASSCLYQ